MSAITLEMLRAKSIELAPTHQIHQARDRNQLSQNTLALISHSPNPETDDEKRKLISALDFLNPDTERGSGNFYDGLGNREEKIWLAVVWAIRSLGWESGKEIAREWSQKSTRYTKDGFEKAWEQYDETRPNRIGIGSLYKWVKDSDRENLPVENNFTQIAQTNKFQLLGIHDIEKLPPSKWIIKGVIPETGLASIYGPSGSGKTFLVLDLILSIASKNEWFGFKVKNTPVIYFGLEGKAGVARRIQAWIRRNGDPGDYFKLILNNFNLLHMAEVQALADLIIQSKLTHGVIVIDTLNQASPSADENSSKDMGLIISHLKQLQELTSSLVLIVHHTGKNTAAGLRGHSSLKAALDTNIEVIGGDKRAWFIEKNKEGADGHSFPFKLGSISLGQDEDGELITSCVVERDTSAIFVKPEPSGKNQKYALKLIKEKIGSSNDFNKCGTGAETTCMKVEDAILFVANSLSTVAKNKRANRARTIVSSLINGGFIGSGIEADEGWLWLK